jgi:hypothetical protein
MLSPAGAAASLSGASPPCRLLSLLKSLKACIRSVLALLTRAYHICLLCTAACCGPTLRCALAATRRASMAPPLPARVPRKALGVCAHVEPELLSSFETTVAAGGLLLGMWYMGLRPPRLAAQWPMGAPPAAGSSRGQPTARLVVRKSPAYNATSDTGGVGGGRGRAPGGPGGPPGHGNSGSAGDSGQGRGPQSRSVLTLLTGVAAAALGAPLFGPGARGAAPASLQLSASGSPLPSTLLRTSFAAGGLARASPYPAHVDLPQSAPLWAPSSAISSKLGASARRGAQRAASHALLKSSSNGAVDLGPEIAALAAVCDCLERAHGRAQGWLCSARA